MYLQLWLNTKNVIVDTAAFDLTSVLVAREGNKLHMLSSFNARRGCTFILRTEWQGTFA